MTARLDEFLLNIAALVASIDLDTVTDEQIKAMVDAVRNQTEALQRVDK